MTETTGYIVYDCLKPEGAPLYSKFPMAVFAQHQDAVDYLQQLGMEDEAEYSSFVGRNIELTEHRSDKMIWHDLDNGAYYKLEIESVQLYI